MAAGDDRGWRFGDGARAGGCGAGPPAGLAARCGGRWLRHRRGVRGCGRAVSPAPVRGNPRGHRPRREPRGRGELGIVFNRRRTDPGRRHHGVGVDAGREGAGLRWTPRRRAAALRATSRHRRRHTARTHRRRTGAGGVGRRRLGGLLVERVHPEGASRWRAGPGARARNRRRSEGNGVERPWRSVLRARSHLEAPGTRAANGSHDRRRHRQARHALAVARRAGGVVHRAQTPLDVGRRGGRRAAVAHRTAPAAAQQCGRCPLPPDRPHRLPPARDLVRSAIRLRAVRRSGSGGSRSNRCGPVAVLVARLRHCRRGPIRRLGNRDTGVAGEFASLAPARRLGGRRSRRALCSASFAGRPDLGLPGSATVS